MPSAIRRSCTWRIANLMMSAALPCMGWFIAVRSPKPRWLALDDLSSGMWRLRPNIVSAKPLSLARTTVSSRYARTPG